MDEIKQDANLKEDVRKIVELSIDDVLPNRFQPRIKFDDSAIFELSESIKIHGVFQPIIVRPLGDKYEIIAGERRYKASVLAGKATVPAIIMNINDSDTIEIALIENVQRSNLTPIEEAISYKKILDMGYINQESLAKKLGKSQSTIANKLRLLNLADEVQEALLENKISERHARSLLKLKDFQDQKILLEKIISQKLTVRKTDEEINNMLNNDQNNINMMNVSNVEAVQPINSMTTNPGVVPVAPAQPVASIEPIAPVAPAMPDYMSQFNPVTPEPVAPAVPVEPYVAPAPVEQYAAPEQYIAPEQYVAPAAMVEPVSSFNTAEPVAPVNPVIDSPFGPMPGQDMPSAPIYNFSDVHNQVFNPAPIDTGVINSSVVNSGMDNYDFNPDRVNNVDVGNIEANAIDFNVAKPVAPMNDFLVGNTVAPAVESVPTVEPETPETMLRPGKFFTFPSEPEPVSNGVDYNASKNFNFDNLYNNSFVNSAPAAPVEQAPATDNSFNFNSFTFSPVASEPMVNPVAAAINNDSYNNAIKMIKDAIQLINSQGKQISVDEREEAGQYIFNIVIPK